MMYKILFYAVPCGILAVFGWLINSILVMRNEMNGGVRAIGES